MTSVFSFPLTTSRMLEDLCTVLPTQYNQVSNSYPFNYYVRKDGTHVLEYALAGFKDDEIDVTIDKDELIITANPDGGTIPKDAKIFKHGISMKKMIAKFTCNNRVLDLENIKASFVDGLLSIEIPESKEEKESQFKVKIN